MKRGSRKATLGRLPAAQSAKNALAGCEIEMYFVPHSARNGTSL